MQGTAHNLAADDTHLCCVCACCSSTCYYCRTLLFNRCGGCWPRPGQAAIARQSSDEAQQPEAAESSDDEAGWEDEGGERPAKGSGGKAAGAAQQAQQAGWDGTWVT